ncbi:MAG: type VII secretion protein EssC [Bacilli bacterium]|nr:type VII secretion protein EssC [Bacilli bacterium]
MIVLLITKNKIIRTLLPKKIYGDYWITDHISNTEKKIMNIEEEDSNWKIKSNAEYQIIDNTQKLLDSVYLKEYETYYIKVNKTDDIYLLYCIPTFDEAINYLSLEGITEIKIGSSKTADIIYKNELMSENHAILNFSNNKWKITDTNSKFGVFLNNLRVKEATINYGDVIFILGLKIIVLNNKIIINNPNNAVSFPKFKTIPYEKLGIELRQIKDEIDEDIELYKEDEYFLRAPRFKTSIEKETLVVDPPPSKVKQDETPAIFMIGSSMTIGVMSLMTLYTTLDSVSAGTRTLTSALPSIIGGSVMLISMILWPILNRRYQRKTRTKQEKERQEKYSKYISEKEKQIDMIMHSQTQILHENYIPYNECEDIILSKNRQLWERKTEQQDFLTVRLGLGDLPVELDIKYPEEHFTMEEDNLKDILNSLVYKSKILNDVPITVSLTQKYILALVGKHQETTDFMKKIIFQLLTFHSYEDLKLVFFVNSETEKKWDYVKSLPHTWSNDKKTRYFASNYEEMQQLSAVLEKELQARTSKENTTYKSFSPYYILIIDDYSISRNIEIVIDALKQKNNLGFNVIVLNETLSSLPNECTTFINVSNMKGGIFESELVSTKQKEFVVDKDEAVDYDKCFLSIANTPIKFANELYSLPNTYSFLEMYNIGKVEQLNSLSRWKMNDSTLSLQVPVGIDTHGLLFNLDIHEKAHGPHGLIAGMTGSGKSEFLITYILSLAVNYHPEDVSFILIDYKGGGLAGAFENEITGVRLPHLAGKITNLDTAEMQRALVSIQSELRRRQKIFNETRKKLNEGVIDIYKYQKLYHSKLVDEPISHLLIISDEFAELKMQQPEFMDQLISTARIGRSLGVHLILATQKPSGIVNDQIRSNSRFRICLKVQESSDSMDVINVPDAAELKQVGRFYLQVGYKEYFALGQSAWAGSSYIPADKLQKKIDKSINFVNNIGSSIKEVEDIPKVNLTVKGDQLTNIVKYLSNTAKMSNINIKQLWLNKIPAIIKLSDLKEKYRYNKINNIVNIVIGEYDDPFNQRKGLLTLNLYKDGNLFIHGIAGSGKEKLLSTIIYSTITTYTPEESNIYILDFGTNLLKVYEEVPHIGDIISEDDIEKITNLFKFLDRSIDNRKNLFQKFGGSYDSYLKNSGATLPLITVILNNYDAFNELYPNFEETLIQLSREGIKYGITFIVTTTSPSIRYKLSQNFAQKLSLRMNDISDYNSILGNVHKLEPGKLVGRGLVKLDNIYEFQTATISDNNELEYIKETVSNIKEKYTLKAPNIPILPSIVSFDTVVKSYKNLNTVPIGIEKESLDVSTIDLKKQLISLISAQNIIDNKTFIYSYIKELELLNNNNLIVIDALKLFDENTFGKANYSNKDLYNIYNKLEKSIEEYNQNLDKNYQNNLVIIIGLEALINNIELTKKADLKLFFENAKKSNKFNFIIMENDSLLKKYAYEDWYRLNIISNQGIWLGNGVTEQYVIKISKMDKSLYQEINNKFGYLVENGNPVLVKLIDYISNLEAKNNE